MKGISLINNKGIISGLVSAIILVLFSSFQSVKDYKTSLAGNWKALWQIRNASSATSEEEMQGYMDFKSDGHVKIIAYGHPGCLFSNDTLKNELKWTINNDSLQLYNHKDQFSLTYVIEQYEKDKILLKLMDDIFVTLRR